MSPERNTSSIWIVIGDLDVGGAEGHIAQVLPALMAYGFRPEIHTLGHKGALAPVVEQAGVPVYGPPFSRLLARLPAMLRSPVLMLSAAAILLFGLLRSRPRIVHCFLPRAYLVGGICAVVARIPVRLMSRRSLNRYQMKYPRLARLEHALHRHMTAVLGNSGAVVRELVAEGVPPSRAVLLHNGIDLAPFEQVPDRGKVRESLGVPERAVVFVIVANLLPYKGHADLLKALAGIKDAVAGDWRLLCIGRDGGIGEKLRVLAHAHGIGNNVMFTGVRQDVPELLGCADIGVLASHEEGFSNAVLEGMAAGLPMVATDVGGNGEAIEDGVSGVIVPPHDPKAMGQALLRLASDPALRVRFGEAARRRVWQEFSLSTCVERYALLYDALLAGEQPPCSTNFNVREPR